MTEIVEYCKWVWNYWGILEITMIEIWQIKKME